MRNQLHLCRKPLTFVRVRIGGGVPGASGRDSAEESEGAVPSAMEEYEVQRRRTQHPDWHGRQSGPDSPRLRGQRQAGVSFVCLEFPLVADTDGYRRWSQRERWDGFADVSISPILSYRRPANTSYESKTLGKGFNFAIAFSPRVDWVGVRTISASL